MSGTAFIDPGWTLAVAATNRPDLRILFYPSGDRRFWHTCTVPPAPDVIAEHATIECSPLLQHEVTVTDAVTDGAAAHIEVTVSPSILCRRCELHGFFVANEWRDA